MRKREKRRKRRTFSPFERERGREGKEGKGVTKKGDASIFENSLLISSPS